MNTDDTDLSSRITGVSPVPAHLICENLCPVRLSSRSKPSVAKPNFFHRCPSVPHRWQKYCATAFFMGHPGAFWGICRNLAPGESARRRQLQAGYSLVKEPRPPVRTGNPGETGDSKLYPNMIVGIAQENSASPLKRFPQSQRRHFARNRAQTRRFMARFGAKKSAFR